MRPIPLITLALAACATLALAAPVAPTTPATLSIEEIKTALRASADWQLSKPLAVEVRHWRNAPLYDGLLRLADVTGDARYLAAVLRHGEQAAWAPGSRTYHADDHAVGHAWLDIYQRDPTRANRLAPFRERFDHILAHPVTDDLEHGRKPPPGRGTGDRWTWCDALYMAPATLARLHAITGDRRYLDLLENEWRFTHAKLWDPAEKLYYRDSRFLNRRTDNAKKIFWGRGNGWVFAGLALTLEQLPPDHTARPFLENIFREMASAVLRAQQSDGLWRPNLADPDDVPTGETSGSGLLAFGLAWGLNHKLLDREKTWPALERAWLGLLTRIQDGGKVGYVQPVGAAPAKLAPDSSLEYGTGAFLLAGSELLRTLGATPPKKAAALLAEAETLHAATQSPRLLKTNGGWCWFQDERAIIVNGKLIFATVAGTDRDGSSPGDIQVTACDITTTTAPTITATLHSKHERDDHCVPALLALPDGRILAAYANHGQASDRKNNVMRWRTTTRPGDITDWTPEQTLPVGSGACYSNLLPVLENGSPRIYNFHRGIGFNPNYLVSDDDGATFTYGGRLLAWRLPKDDPARTGLDGSRPYLKYALHPPGDMHIVSTDSHPRAYDNSIYHAIIRDGQILHTDGRPIAPLSRTQDSPVAPNTLTRVFAGDADHVAWPCDIHVDKNGHPRILFTVQRGGAPYRTKRGAPGDGQDHRFYHARWDGAAWQVNEIAHASSRLYSGEDDYTGLGALDPQHPGIIYISTNADPKTGAPLISATDGKRHHELYRGATTDDGKTWTWHPLTRDSATDNLRPIVPIWPDSRNRALVLWLRGSLTTFRDYDLDVVSLIDTW